MNNNYLFSNYFVVDANDMPLDDTLLKVLYKTDTIDNFLSNNSVTKDYVFAVSSPKGYGKTFVLKAKKIMMQNETGTLLIPENQELDYIVSIRYNSETTSFFQDYKNWVDLWQTSIVLSAIKNAILKDYGIEDYFNELPDNCKEIINNALYITPCQYFNYLYTDLNRKKLNELFKAIPKLVIVYQQIHSQICMFIDNIDEAMVVCLEDDPLIKTTHGKFDRKFWTYAQISLVEAISKLHKFSQHIKIYCSIRQEAVNSERTELNQQMLSHIAKIEYTYKDLKSIYQNYINLITDYNSKAPNPLKTISSINHINTGESENIFDYIYRHTLKNPRDIMDMLKDIYSTNKQLSEKEFREIVNNKSTEICRGYIERIETFINDYSSEDLDLLFSLIYSNVISNKDIKEICRKFNALKSGITCNGNCNECDLDKPFYLLYRIGLLGYIENPNFETRKKQCFLPCGNSLIPQNESLPNSKYYFIHPSLDQHIYRLRNKCNLCFTIVDTFIIGDNKEYVESINEKDIVTNRKILISSTCLDLEEVRLNIKKHLNEKGFNLVYINEDNGEPFNQINIHNHDKCLKAVEEVDIVILLVDKRYGGEYSGEIMHEESDEIAAKAIPDGLNKKLSITWCEFIQAQKSGKTVYSFISQKVWDERHIFIENKKRDIDIYTPFVKDHRAYYFAEYVDKNAWVHKFYNNYEEIIDKIDNELVIW